MFPATLPALPAVGFLQSLPSSDRSAISCAGTYRDIPAGGVLLRQGEPQDQLFLVLAGKLKASCHSETNQVELGVILPGESVGEMNLIDPSAASADVKAVLPTRVWGIRRDTFQAFVESRPDVGLGVMKDLARQLCERLRRSADKVARGSEACRPGPN